MKIFTWMVFLLVRDITSEVQSTDLQHANMTGCMTCPPGFGVEHQCLDNEETRCASCRPGETFSTTYSDVATCMNCSKCPLHALLLKECNVTHDTECVCEKGFYLDNETNQCLSCELCSHGWGVARQCSPKRNTVCRKCPPGTYSGLLSATLGCELCTTCRANQAMLQECTPIQDTICIDKDLYQRSHLPATESEPVPNEVENYTQRSVIPVYCTILVAILLGILVFLVLRWSLQQHHYTKTTHCEEGGPGPDPDGTSECSKRMLLDKSDQSMKLINDKFLSHTVIMQMKLKELPLTKQRDLEEALNTKRQDGQDWRGLARQLGYSNSNISAFEHLGKVKHGPAHQLLLDWDHFEGATVEALIQALLTLGRMDVVRLFQPTCERVYPPVQSDYMV